MAKMLTDAMLKGLKVRAKNDPAIQALLDDRSYWVRQCARRDVRELYEGEWQTTVSPSQSIGFLTNEQRASTALAAPSPRPDDPLEGRHE
jgi:hypothetical protein